MSLIIATGSNIGEKSEYLKQAASLLSEQFYFIQASRIYSSPAVDYEKQPDFYNQLLEFKIPSILPTRAIEICLDIEQKMGRRRDIPKGPRTIDIDIIFWGLKSIDEPQLTVPHPSWSRRSFIVYPLQELPYFETLKNHYRIPENFNNTAKPI